MNEKKLGILLITKDISDHKKSDCKINRHYITAINLNKKCRQQNLIMKKEMNLSVTNESKEIFCLVKRMKFLNFH